GIHMIDENCDWLQTVLQPSPTPGGWMTYAVDLSEKNRHQLKRLAKANSDSSATAIGPIKRLFELSVQLYSTHPNWSTKDSGALPLSMRLANVRAVCINGKKIEAVDAHSNFSGEPKRISSLSDAAQMPFAWLVDSQLGSPARGTDSQVDGTHEFSVQSTYV